MDKNKLIQKTKLFLFDMDGTVFEPSFLSARAVIAALGFSVVS